MGITLLLLHYHYYIILLLQHKYMACAILRCEDV